MEAEEKRVQPQPASDTGGAVAFGVTVTGVIGLLIGLFIGMNYRRKKDRN